MKAKDLEEPGVVVKSHQGLDVDWKNRVMSKLAVGAVVGSVGGATIATIRSNKALSVPYVAFNMGTNFALFAGLCGCTQELIRASTGNTTWFNSFASGFITGGFLCGINRGPRSIVPGSFVFGTTLGLAHLADDSFHFYDKYRSALVSMDLLYIDEEEQRKLRSIEASEESWDLGKYWPSFIPAPIRIHSAEEVEQLAILRRKKLQDKMNPRPKQKDEEEKPR